MIRLVLPLCRTVSQNQWLANKYSGQAVSLLHSRPSRLDSNHDYFSDLKPVSALRGSALSVCPTPVRHLHETRSDSSYKLTTRESFTDVPPTSTHVFRIKRKLPVSLREPGRFSFLSLGSLLSTPGPYMIYGLGGLIPFMSAPYYMHLLGAYSPWVAHGQLVYGACILSFLGGVSWGDHFKRSEKASLRSLRYSIILPLVAWPAVLLYPNPGSFGLMIGGIVYAGMRDVKCESYPAWFKNLRFLLTTLVALSLSTTLIFSFTKEKWEGSGEVEDNDD